jgi:hypothetical protein
LPKDKACVGYQNGKAGNGIIIQMPRRNRILLSRRMLGGSYVAHWPIG